MVSVLVTYASKYGSTREVAEAVANTLRDCGVEAVVRPAGLVRDLKGYSAVVLGTALYFFHWRGEAHRFLRRNRREMTGLPVAVFGLGPIEDTPQQFEGALKHLDKGLAKHPWLTPVSVDVFGGRLDPTHLRFPDNNAAVRNMGTVDLRDFEAIRTWARGLIKVIGLRPEAVPRL